jgi:KipI family sensor histidine kinase inhibitor
VSEPTTVPMRVLPVGDAGLLFEVPGLPEVLALADAVRAAPPAGVLDVVPAARTVLLVLEPGTELAATGRAVLDLPLELGAAAADGEVVQLEVVYDGPDLDEVARLTGLGADGVVAAHTGSRWRVAFGGFAPGFAYLAGGDARLDVTRRDEPRTRVPAGSVGLAGEFSGVYPRPSPGGWQLIGYTEAELWSPERGALLRPGGWVQFRARS